MRRFGAVLLAMGVLLGLAVGVGMLAGVKINGVHWLVAVGMIKLTLLAAVGLISAGAMLQRLGKRAEERERLR